MQLTATLARIRCSQCIVVRSQCHLCDTIATGFGGLFDGFMSLTSYFDVKYRYYHYRNHIFLPVSIFI